MAWSHGHGGGKWWASSSENMEDNSSYRSGSLTSVIPASLASSVAMVVLQTCTAVNFPSSFLHLLMGGAVFSLDEIFIGIDGFFSDVLLGEEVGVGWGSGCVSLYNLVFSIVVWGSVHVVWDVDHLFDPVDFGVDFFQPRGV